MSGLKMAGYSMVLLLVADEVEPSGLMKYEVCDDSGFDRGQHTKPVPWVLMKVVGAGRSLRSKVDRFVDARC